MLKRILLKAAVTVGFLKEKETPFPKPPDFTQDSDLNELVMKSTNELIIEREWKKKQLMKLATKEETYAQKYAAEAAEARQKKEDEDKKWEAGREKRIGSWRDFQKGAAGGKKKKRKLGMLKMPKVRAEDPSKSYVRRPIKRG